MPLNTGTAKLALGLKTLRAQWEATRAHWRDQVGEAFEEHHLRPLEMDVLAALRAMDELGRVLGQAERECS